MNFEQLKPCEPPLWAPNGQLQTMLAYLLPSPQLQTAGKQIILPLPDGDKLSLHYYVGEKPILIYLFHGLTGTIHSNYMQRTARLCQQLGFHVVLTNHRGCGDGKGLAKNPYHSGRAEDLSEVVSWGRKNFPNFRHGAIGFSLSGNALLLLMAYYRGICAPDAAISVNPPIDLAKCSDLISTGWNKIYDNHFTKECKDSVHERVQHQLIKPVRFPKRMKLRDFDEFYTAPAGGFKNAKDYYQQCSAKDFLHKIKNPSIILTAANDPFIPSQDFLEYKKSPSVFCHIENHGGHLGYLSKNCKDFQGRWLDYALKECLRELNA